MRTPQQTIAVTRRPHAAAPRQLADAVPRNVRRPGVPAGAGGLVGAAGPSQQPHEVVDGQRLTATGGVDAGRQQSIRRLASRARPLHKRVARSLAPLRECDVHEFEYPPSKSVVGGPGRGLISIDAYQPGIDTRNGPENGRRHHAAAANPPEEAQLNAGHAVLFAARLGGEPFGDLGLHHHRHDTDRRELDKQMQQRRYRYVVRQIGNHRGRRRG